MAFFKHTITMPEVDEEVGPCPWVYEDVCNFKHWFARFAQKMRLPDNIERFDVVRSARTARVTFFGARELRNGEIHLARVADQGFCDNLHHIDISSKNEFVTNAMATILEGMLATSLRFADEVYQDFFHGESQMPWITTPTPSNFANIWNYEEELTDSNGDAYFQYTWRLDFDTILAGERNFNVHARWCRHRKILVIQGDDISAIMRIRLNMVDFIQEKTARLAHMHKKRNPVLATKKKVHVEKTSTHFFDWNNPYTLLSKCGYGLAYNQYKA